MGGAFGTCWDNRYIRNQSLKESDQFEDERVGEVMLLKWTFEEVGCGLYSRGAGKAPLAVSYDTILKFGVLRNEGNLLAGGNPLISQ
jgi:hypothetical protein